MSELDAALAAWKERVWDRRAEIDPTDRIDWYDMATGFALAFDLNDDDVGLFLATITRRKQL